MPATIECKEFQFHLGAHLWEYPNRLIIYDTKSVPPHRVIEIAEQIMKLFHISCVYVHYDSIILSNIHPLYAKRFELKAHSHMGYDWYVINKEVR